MRILKLHLLLCAIIATATCSYAAVPSRNLSEIRDGFIIPPDSSRPGVYWYFMDGNQSKDAITKDLESMKEHGLGHLVYLEVNVGVPRGGIDFLTTQWKEHFKYAVEEAERLGIAITLGVGPGWTGSGGPWVKPEQSMQHLVHSTTQVSGGKQVTVKLPRPKPSNPYFGIGGLTEKMKVEWENYFDDVAVIAFPTSKGNGLDDVYGKALYYREPYSSKVGVPQYLPTYSAYKEQEGDGIVDRSKIVDLTAMMAADGNLVWNAPQGEWTIMRFGSCNNGAVTRPAPSPGVGMESDKFDTVALNEHLKTFPGELFDVIGERDTNLAGGLKILHMDSWEMGAQNWTARLREEFTKRRGYDPQPFYPVYAGVIVESRQMSERFLWDLRLTSQELVLEKHATHIKNYAHKRGMRLSIEPYDMNPTADLELGAIADLPMCEYWSVGMGFSTSFSAVTGTSLAHLKGQPAVPAEAFTAERDGWRQHPGSMKDQSDWAFASGINRLMYHTFAHQSLPDSLRPGMTMGPYGVHWDRNQTWWHLSDAYHRYVTRTQYMLQQGRTVADVLYLSPEGAPHVFLAPESALDLNVYEGAKDLNGRQFTLPDKRGYNFDGCPPSLLYGATAENGQVVFESGATYKLLVLPIFETMTPQMLNKIAELVRSGATVVGLPPKQSPSLENYPNCDQQIKSLVDELWGGYELPKNLTTRKVGQGQIIYGQSLLDQQDRLYPSYGITSEILASKSVPEDFTASVAKTIRYTHRTADGFEIYFVANRTDKPVSLECVFRVDGKVPELWSSTTAETRLLPEYSVSAKRTTIPLTFEPFESFFVVFCDKSSLKRAKSAKNFNKLSPVLTLDGAWDVSFDPKWGGPEKIVFDKLSDWTTHTNSGIKYYSGSAIYQKTFDFSGASSAEQLFLDLGEVKNLAKVWLNGKDLGIIWCSPWRVDIGKAVKRGKNTLKIEVVNLWPNRLIGDEHLPDDSGVNGQWPEWLIKGQPRTSGRYTFTSFKHYTKDSPLLKSGLIGPVKILESVK